jgi:hypothetical protein
MLLSGATSGDFLVIDSARFNNSFDSRNESLAIVSSVLVTVKTRKCFTNFSQNIIAKKEFNLLLVTSTSSGLIVVRWLSFITNEAIVYVLGENLNLLAGDVLYCSGREFEPSSRRCFILFWARI